MINSSAAILPPVSVKNLETKRMYYNLDSGTTEHVEIDDGHLSNKTACHLQCVTADGKPSTIKVHGDRDILIPADNGMMQYTIEKGIVLEGADERLLAVRKLVRDKRVDHVHLSWCHSRDVNTSYILLTDGNRIPIHQTESGAYRIYVDIPQQYMMQEPQQQTQLPTTVALTANAARLMTPEQRARLVHRRTMHIGGERVLHTPNLGMQVDRQHILQIPCLGCAQGKQKRKPRRSKLKRADKSRGGAWEIMV